MATAWTASGTEGSPTRWLSGTSRVGGRSMPGLPDSLSSAAAAGALSGAGRDDVVLQVAQGLTRRVMVVPGPDPGAVEVPRRHALVHRQRHELLEFGDVPRVAQPHHRLHTAVEGAVHHVGAPDVHHRPATAG